jgi:phosphatidyl-myo-inositol dimannoside synthase
MKILIFSPDFLPNTGGIAVFIKKLAEQLSNLGHQVDVLTLAHGNNKSIDEKQPYKIYRYSPLKRFSSATPIINTLRLHVKNQYDVCLLGHFELTAALGIWLLNRLFKTPYIILSHGNDLRRTGTTWIDRMAIKCIINNAALMLGNSNYTAELIRQKGYKGLVAVLTPGVETGEFIPNLSTSAVRTKYELNNQRILFTTSRLIKNKNIEGVLRAMPQVIKKRPDLLYLVAGDGEFRKELEELSTALNIGKHVKFIGHIDNDQLPALYCASDVFVLPSFIETFGIVYIEAGACGKPVIGGKIGGVSDAVIDNETGVLIKDPSNAREISDAILYLLNNKQIADEMGRKSRERIVANFDWAIVGRRLEKYLKQVAK